MQNWKYVTQMKARDYVSRMCKRTYMYMFTSFTGQCREGRSCEKSQKHAGNFAHMYFITCKCTTLGYAWWLIRGCPPRTEGNVAKVKFVRKLEKGYLRIMYAAASPVLSSLRSVPPRQESLGRGWGPFLGVYLHWCARGIRMDA